MQKFVHTKKKKKIRQYSQYNNVHVSYNILLLLHYNVLKVILNFENNAYNFKKNCNFKIYYNNIRNKYAFLIKNYIGNYTVHSS